MEIHSARQLNELKWAKSCWCWLDDYQIKNEKGEILEFKDRAFLKDIFDDFSPQIVCRKPSQIGFSVTTIIKSLWAIKYKGWNVIYTLPTFSDVNQFVPSKVNALISNNPILTDWTKDKDSVTQKQIGKGFIYYRGTFSNKTDREKMESGVGIMLSSDLNIHDECDRSDQTIIEQYESRLEASNYQGKWLFSNPSTPNTLSQKMWEKSDQKYWFIKCEHCGEWQTLDFYKNIKEIDGIHQFVCFKCQGIISDDTRRKGKWVKRFKDREISGYQINHLICPWISAEKIYQTSITKTKQYFYNFVLGLPYIGSDIAVNKDVILKNIDNTEPNFLEGNVMGVDQGLKKHYVIGNKQGIFRVGVANEWSEIEQLMTDYDVSCAVFDALPDLTEPRKLRDKYPSKVWLNYFKKEVKSTEFIKWDTDTHTVYSDRTKIIQQVIDEFSNRKIRFQMKPEDLYSYTKHWETLYKIVETDNMGIERDVWESSGEDHFAFATLYFRLALEKLGSGLQTIEWSKKETPITNIAPKLY